MNDDGAHLEYPRDDEPRNRIFHTAIRLFAQKGYAATGVRELSREAGVNLAMVNYFYGSKFGLLKAIIDDFFSGYLEVIRQCLIGEDAHLEKMRKFIRGAIGYFRLKPEQALIAIAQLSLDTPEATEIKTDWVKRIIEIYFGEMYDGMSRIAGRPLPMEILGPGMAALMMSHFIFKPVVQNVWTGEFDDEFYRFYAEVIGQVALFGVTSLGEMSDPNHSQGGDIV